MSTILVVKLKKFVIAKKNLFGNTPIRLRSNAIRNGDEISAARIIFKSLNVSKKNSFILLLHYFINFS